MFSKPFFYHQLTKKILPFWLAQQDSRGGFYGMCTIHLQVDETAPKGGVMAGRFLWTFSRCYSVLKNPILKDAADHAYRFLKETILDPEYGGSYWLVSAEGKPLEEIKHIYAQSFAIYGLSEYARIAPDSGAKALAIDLFKLVEAKAYNQVQQGYWEEFTRDWQPKAMSQVGSGTAATVFTTNTHLHLLEAYTNLYRIWPDERLSEKIEILLSLFADVILTPEGYCHTEFDGNWNPISSEVSFGHDIETSWLLKETLEVCQIDQPRIEDMVRKLGDYVFQNGLDKDGILLNLYDFSKGEWDRTRVWWAEAEAVVGFYHAYQLTGEEKYRLAAEKIWTYIQQYFVDSRKNSEWFSRLNEQEQVLSSLYGNAETPEPISDKWKGPYHTVRMYLEMMKRLGGLQDDGME